MFKRFMLSLLLLGSMVPSLQAEPIEEQPDIDIEDKCFAAVAGFCSAYVIALGVEAVSWNITKSYDCRLLSVLGTLAFYSFFSRKLAKKDDQIMKMFGRGGFIGICCMLKHMYPHIHRHIMYKFE